MAQVSKGIRTVLESPWIYSTFQNLVSKKPIWPDLIEEFLPRSDEPLRVLDIGCGPGTFLHGNWFSIDRKNFVGIDPSPEYIERAKADFPAAQFFEGTVETVSLEDRKFDLVVLSGVLHHLDDAEATAVMKFATEHLAQHGHAISIDPVLFPGQNPIARWMALLDRGQNVRTLEQMRDLWSENITGAVLLTSVKEGYLRVPYNHIVCVIKYDAVSGSRIS